MSNSDRPIFCPAYHLEVGLSLRSGLAPVLVQWKFDRNLLTVMFV